MLLCEHLGNGNYFGRKVTPQFGEKVLTPYLGERKTPFWGESRGMFVAFKYNSC